MDSMKIGGENYINKHFRLKRRVDKIDCYSSGQSALLIILNTVFNLGYTKIYLPNFICDSVFNSCKKLNFDIITYDIDPLNFEPIWTTISMREKSIIYFVSYYGFIEDNPFVLKVKLNQKDIITISDRVQDYYNVSKSQADFAYNSFRKFLPITEGSEIINNTDLTLTKPSKYNKWSKYKYYGAFLKFFNFKDEKYLKIFNKSENILLSTFHPMYMSKIGKAYFNLFDHKRIKLNRQKNYKFAYKFGEDLGLDFIFKYKEGLCPIAIPVRVNSSKNLKKYLYKNNCFLNSFWPNVIAKSNLSENILNHTINIIINHSVNEDMIRKQILLINKFNKK